MLFLLEEGPSGSWMIDGCGNSGPSEGKLKALQQIEAIDQTSDRLLIAGAVGGISSSFPLAGVQVEVRGPGGVTTTAKTKSDGTFEIHVLPGTYQARALEQGKTFVAADLTYEDPDALFLEGGGCAQVQFVEAAKGH